MSRASLKWFGIGAIAVLILACMHPRERSIWLIYNPSVSAPKGWYTVSVARDLKVDDFVLANLPAGARNLADRRGYLPKTVPLLKRIGAISDQFVCVRGASMWVDGALVATSLTHDGHGRRLTPWQGCRVLGAQEFLLISRENSASFDSRYFGPIPITRVLGKASPLWTW